MRLRKIFEKGNGADGSERNSHPSFVILGHVYVPGDE